MSDLNKRDLGGSSSGDASQHPPKAAGPASRGSVLDTVKTIAWSFFGIRRRVDHDQETPKINPIHIVVAGFVGVFVLVVGLIVLVNLVVAA